MRFMLRLSLAALAVASLTASGVADRVDSEYRRLEEQLKRISTDDAQLQSARNDLNRGAQAAGAEYRLYRLRDAFVSVERLRYFVDHKSALKSHDTFQDLWAKERSRFEKRPDNDRGTVLERALAQSSATRAERLFRASLAYSKATNPTNGVYYLGEASANLAFRDFVRGLEGDQTERTPSASQLASALNSLEAAMLQFFGEHVGAPDAIPVSARLKEARELLADGRIEGATLMAVEAEVVLADRGGPDVSTATSATPPAGSMSSLLTQWTATVPAEKKKARGKAMTFYASLFSPSKQAVATRPQVTVTLVRWPYT